MDASARIIIFILAGIAFQLNLSSAAHLTYSDDKSGAIAGRFVSIPAQAYRKAFGFVFGSLKLGKCPLVKQGNSIIVCEDKFEGEATYIEKGKTIVDVSKAQYIEDIFEHTMGEAGFGSHVLGLVGVNPKIKVAVKTDTSKNALNFISSYEMIKGSWLLRNPRPKFVEGDKALFLSEIDIGGSEMFLVTLKFESEEEKVEVESSYKFKVFTSMSDRLEYAEKTFKSKPSCRIQLTSSWRREFDEDFSVLSRCIPRVKEVEDMYLKGPQEILDMNPEDEKSHYFYYFSAWKSSPFGSQDSLAWINYDTEFLTEQIMEMRIVLERIEKLKNQFLPNNMRKEISQLETTVTDILERITDGLRKYKDLTPEERDKLHDIYGRDKAPMHYKRKLEKIASSKQERF